MHRAIPVNSSFLLALIHGMRSRMFEADRLSALLGSRNLSELMRMLRPNREFASHRLFEQDLVNVHVAELDRLTRYLPEPFLAVFLGFLRRYQVEDIKVVLRGWARHADPDDVAAHLAELPRPHRLPVPELLAARDLEEFVRLLPDDLRKGARLGTESFLHSGTTFFIEAGLDRAWMKLLLDLARALPSRDRRAVLDLLALEIDQFHVLFTLRARHNYNLSPEDLDPLYLPASGIHVGPGELHTLAVRTDLADCLAHLPQPQWLLGPSPPPAPPDSLESLQDLFSRRLFDHAAWRFHHSVRDFGAVLAYAYIKRRELANLITLTEALRYDIPRAATVARLMGSGIE